MTDIEKTRAELLALFADGQGEGAINPQDMRDYVVTTDINNLSTGLINGGIVTINSGDNTAIDIAAGTGVFIDNSTTPSAPIRKRVTWTDFISENIPLLASTPVTFLGLDLSSGTATVVKQSTDFTAEQRRDIVILAVAVHGGNTVVESIGPIYKYSLDTRQTLDDLALAIGTINVGAGNNFSANASGDLTIDKSAGQTFSIGGNYQNSQKIPNTTIDAALTPVPFHLYTYQDGSGGFTLTGAQFVIDPDNLDNGSGTLASLSPNKFTTQRIWFFSEINLVIIHYGQTEYGTLDDALMDINTEIFVRNTGLTTGFRGWLIVKQGTTDLTDIALARFVSASMFGDILRP